jgi:hypothetical protein
MAHLSRILCAASAALALAACTDRTTEPDATSSILNGGPPDASAVKFWEAGAAVGWNGIARGLTIVNPQSPIGGQRIFAYLNLAVYDAVAAVEAAAGHPSPQAAAGGAAVTVLSFFFPGDITALEAALTAQEGGAHWPGELHTDIAAGEAIGRNVGQQVVAAIQTDNFNAPFLGTYPLPRSGMWTPTLPLTSAVLPGLKDMRPFFLTSADQFRPPLPWALGSTEFQLALQDCVTLRPIVLSSRPRPR